jgi:hypothetical protein
MIAKIFRQNGMLNNLLVDLRTKNSVVFLRPMNDRRLKNSRTVVLNSRFKLGERDEVHTNGSSDDIYFSPMYASGSVISTIMLESLMAGSYHQPCLIDLYNTFCGIIYEV